ncbi:hypothetical protein SAMN06296427_108116 [Moheibacter sediminis]|uniref:Uncharacterized protein n=1 Tax=Moheibacter sediminis TaxID=1434700 RepID=A0A1W2C3W2_9FLAO|nr:hypothetical protein SAMN06296427_108116 [Moheibacter sediminis]
MPDVKCPAFYFPKPITHSVFFVVKKTDHLKLTLSDLRFQNLKFHTIAFCLVFLGVSSRCFGVPYAATNIDTAQAAHQALHITDAGSSLIHSSLNFSHLPVRCSHQYRTLSHRLKIFKHIHFSRKPFKQRSPQ